MTPDPARDVRWPARVPRAAPSCFAGLACLFLAFASGACASVAALGVPDQRVHAPRSAPIDVEHYALTLELDPRARRIEAEARVRLCSRVDALQAVELDLVDLEVHAVRGDQGEPLGFEHADGVLRIRLARPLARGEFVELRVEYGGAPRRGLYFEDAHAGVATQVFTQGECEDSRGWFPCLDFPSERATSEVAVVMPAAWTSLAAGELVERRELGAGRALERWRMATPHPAYLTTLVAGDFAVHTDHWDGIPLLYLADPALEPLLDGRFRETPRILEFLSRLTGVRYPYPKYGQAVVANFPFGGMENVSATTLTDAWLTDERGARDEPAAGLIAHEAAHQWFGDLLTSEDWAHIWLNEGWATYAGELYVEASAGREAFETAMNAVRESYLAQDVGAARRPIVHAEYREPMDLFVTGHAYPGAASRLHQLRFELGDEAFFAGVRRYFAEHRGTAVGTRDFQASMEAASGADLAGFFAQWFFGRGYPELATRWSWDAAAAEVVLEVLQVQGGEDGTPRAFRLQAEVEIACAGLEPRLERVTLDERRETLRFPSAAKPRWVVLDPHGWLVARRSDEREAGEWIALAERSLHPIPRRDAVLALANLAQEAGAPRARLVYAQAIEARLVGDDSAEVRAVAARALAPLAPDFGRDALQSAAASDASAFVRVAALQSLAVFAPDESLATFAREQYLAGFSWATMAAATALELRARKSLEVWTERMQVPSPHDTLAASVLASVVHVLERESARDVLLGRLASSTAPAVREAALRALAGFAAEDARVRGAIESCLADPAYRVRGAALDALAAAQDPRCLPAVRAAYPSLAEPRHRRAAEKLLFAPWASKP